MPQKFIIHRSSFITPCPLLSISEIHVYPVKSLSGIALTESRITPLGLEHDRRFMLVDEAGRFVSQREIPAMTQLGTAISGEYLTIFHRKNTAERVEIPLRPTASDLEKLRVQVWSAKCAARLLHPDLDAWFSDQLGQRLRLVYMPDTTRRRTSHLYAPGHHVSFADGYPVLLIGQASLDHLNSRLAQPLPMNRFRPNLVFTGGQPHEEDELGEFSIGAARFRGVKRCGRCTITTTDQDTGQRAAEPLKTLATYRRHGNRIVFGENLVWLGGGDVVKIGDEIRRNS